MINPCAEPIPEDILERTKKMSSSLLSDGAKFISAFIPQGGCLGAACKPVGAGMQVLGTALTVQTSGGSIYPIQVAIKYAKPGYVLVIDGGGCQDRAYAGDIVFSACQAVGLNGFVIDGYTRDISGTVALGFPVFSTGITARGPVREKCGSVNIPIRCCGVTVYPGDLVLGDADGVVVIPREHILAVLNSAESKIAFEENRRKMISDYCSAKASGRELPEIVPQWALDLLEDA